MEIDRQTAAALGFGKLDYVKVQRERRWLCREAAPQGDILSIEAITDTYITGARLRLREARPLDGGAPLTRLSRKADVDSRTRLITSIYMPEEEFALLAAALPGLQLKKLRHRLKGPPGVIILFDKFQGALEGLMTAEAEFDTPELMAAFQAPSFAGEEITDDPRFDGIHLAQNGWPA
jgi:CYTH domain-containing protein